MKIGLFGGSFDPIHFGHVKPVVEAMTELALDRVIYLPTGRPPHKPDRKLAPALARYAMAEIALLADERLWVSGRELDESAPSYTIDTLVHFRDAHPGDELHLLIGSDSYLELRSWHRVEEIVEIARLAVLIRPAAMAPIIGGGTAAASSTQPSGPQSTGTTDGLGPTAGVQEAAPRVRFVHNRPLDVSSTAVRRCLARGERPPAGWVPDAVVDFALKYRLYR